MLSISVRKIQMKPNFPLGNSPQRLGITQPIAAGKKVPLNKGYSLMDWIKLTKSGADLRGTGSGLLHISLEELKIHDKVDDAWMAIRGFVYNVTQYMNYHPGGKDELLRGAGKDGTELFDEIHRWVNFESMLKACLIGRLIEHKNSHLNSTFLVPSSVDLPKLGTMSQKTEVCISTPGSSMSIPQVMVSSPILESVQTDWTQTDEEIKVVCSTDCKLLTETNVVCDLEENGQSLKGEVFIDDKVLIIGINLHNQVELSLNVKVVENSGTIEIELRKKIKFLQWEVLGRFCENHGKAHDRKLHTFHFRSCKLVGITAVTHDTFLYQFRLPDTCFMHIPIGCHVYLQANIEGMCVSRPYTAVIPDMTNKKLEGNCHNIFAMIKIYACGTFTSYLKDLSVNDNILISSYEGSFHLGVISPYQCIVLLCAGTGFTPMIRILHHCLHKTNKQVYLFFFNKESKDILCKTDLEKFAEKFPEQFQIENVLSNPGVDWKGQTGHISLTHVRDIYDGSNLSKFTCVCGTPAFTRLTLKLLNKLGIKRTEIYAFTN